MPLIPLFNDGQQVPQAQIGPAPQGQRQRVIMDLNAATANFATPLLPMELADRSGYDRLGQAFGNASDLLGGLALKKAEAVNIRRVGEGQAQMQQQLAEFDAWKQKNPDETTWEGEWAGRLETMRESVFGENLSPAARETLQTSYQQFAAQSKIGLTTEVTKVSFRKAAETQLGLAATAFERGDPATADAHLKKAADAGYLSREDARRSSAAGHAQVKARALDGLKNLHQQADVALEGNDLPTAAHLLAESRSLLDDLNGSVLDSPQHAEYAATLAYQENHYTLRQQMLESPLEFQAQVSTGQRDFKKLSPQDQHALLDGAQQQVQKRGFEEAQKAAGIIARADVDDLSLTKGMEMTSLQDFGISEIDHVPEPLRHALSFQTRVKQGLASLDRPGLSQQARTWITGYDPAQDPGSLRRQEMELWFDLSFDRPTAGRLRQELAAQVQQPYPAVSLHRAFARADELASGIPLSAPAPHWTESLAQYYPQDRQRSQQADQVKDLLVRKQKSGDLKDEDAALALVEAAYTPEKRGPAHGGTAIIPVNIGAELSQLPEQTTSKDGRVDPVYNPFHVSLVKGGASQPAFRSPLAIARAAAQHDLSPVEIAQALKEHHRQQEKQGRQGDVKNYWSGMAQLDADTTAVMQRLQVSAQQQILQSRLTDPEQMRRFQAVLAQRVQAPEQPILPEFLPLMEELDAVLEAPAFQATRPASTYGSVKEGETTLAYYGTRLNAEGQLDLLIQLSDDRQYLRSLPPVTPADVQAKITELENTIRHSQAQAESARARLSGPSLAAMGPGAMGAANGALAEIEHAEQKVQQAQAEQQKLAAQGPRYLLDQRVREELKKPEWEGLVGTYNAGEEILKGLARAGLHANALVTRLFGEENGLNQAGGHLSESLGIPHTPVTLKRLNAADQALDTALPGSTRRRLEGGTWNQAVLGLQQGAGYMAPGLLGGWGVSLAARGTSAAARIAAGRIGVAGGSSFITAAGGSYVQTEGLIQQALADNDPARAQQLAKYRDAHALLTGLTELAIERFSPLHKMTPNGMHGIAKNAVDMGKEVAENPLTSLLQQNVLDRGLLGTPGYDWNNLPAELLTSLMTAGLLKSGQKGIERLAGGSVAPVSTQAPLETPPIEDVNSNSLLSQNLTLGQEGLMATVGENQLQSNSEKEMVSDNGDSNSTVSQNLTLRPASTEQRSQEFELHRPVIETIDNQLYGNRTETQTQASHSVRSRDELLESATRHLGGSSGPSGPNEGATSPASGGERGSKIPAKALNPKEARRQLIEWAREKELLMTSLPPQWTRGSSNDKAGREHHAFPFAVGGTIRWLKVTKGNGANFGLWPKDQGKDWALEPKGSIQDYLRRIQDANLLLGEDIILHGVLQDPQSGAVSIVTSQRHVKETTETKEQDVVDAMESEGFLMAGNTATFYRASDNLAIFDAHLGNVARVGDTLEAFDVIIMRPEGRLKQYLESATHDRVKEKDAPPDE